MINAGMNGKVMYLTKLHFLYFTCFDNPNSKPKQKTGLCQSSGSESPASQQGGLGSIPEQVMVGKTGPTAASSPGTLVFPLRIIIPAMLYFLLYHLVMAQ
jgi:hypothetical protein